MSSNVGILLYSVVSSFDVYIYPFLCSFAQVKIHLSATKSENLTRWFSTLPTKDGTTGRPQSITMKVFYCLVPNDLLGMCLWLQRHVWCSMDMTPQYLMHAKILSTGWHILIRR